MKKNALRVLITGGTGLLGIGLLDQKPNELEIIPTYFNNNRIKRHKNVNFVKLDITNKPSVDKLFIKYLPNITIHAASVGNVDYCEKNKNEAYKINVEGTKNIVEACYENRSKLVFLSSNAVFDGVNPPYKETSELCPINYYGQTKVLGEKIVQNNKINFIIVRLILMYGWNHPKERQNPVTWLIDKLEQKEKIVMVNDTYTNPVLNIQAAKFIWELIKKEKTGIYHIAGKERINRYDFARKTAEVFSLNKKLITQVPSSFFKGIAKRMYDTTYDTSKIEKELLVKPLDIKDGLLYMKKNKIKLKWN